MVQSISARPIGLLSASRTQNRTEIPDFQAVILCGYGESLYPLTEGKGALPKALMPIGGEVMLDRVLAWVENSGIIDVLLLCPKSHQQRITALLRSTRSSSSHRLRIDVHNLSERADRETLVPPAPMPHGRAQSMSAPSGSGVIPSGEDEDDGEGAGVGTGRVLRRWRDWLTSDFVLLPCDISPPPSLTLSSLLDRHRAAPHSLLTTLWYERSELDLKDKDASEAVLVGWDKKSEEILLIQALEELEHDLPLRMGLLRSHPTLSLTTSLLDAHVYVLRRSVLDLMLTREPKDLESVREDLVPWLVKGGWQKGLGDRWGGVLNTQKDPLAAALHKSTASPFSTLSPPTAPASSGESGYPTQPSTPTRSGGEALLDFKDSLPTKSSRSKKGNEEAGLRCNIAVWRTPVKEVVEVKGRGKVVGGAEKPVEGLLRGNTVAGYWELNRQFLRQMPPNLSNLPPATPPPTPSPSAPPPNIDPKAMISPDSLVHPSTRVGERSSVKKSIVGRHCVVGKGVRMVGCVVWDFVVIEDGAKLENVILCGNVRVGEKSQIKDSEIGSGVEIAADSNIKGERIAEGQDA